MECIKTITKDCANDCPYNIKISHICKSSCLQTNKYYNKFTLFDIIQIFDFFFFLEMRIGGGDKHHNITGQLWVNGLRTSLVLFKWYDSQRRMSGCVTTCNEQPLFDYTTVTPQCTCKKNRRNNVMERNNPFKTWAVV